MNSKDWLKTGVFSLAVGVVLLALAFVPPLYLLVAGILIIAVASVLLARRVFDTGPLVYLLASGALSSLISFVPVVYILVSGSTFVGGALVFFVIAYRAPSPRPRSRRRPSTRPPVMVHVQQVQWITDRGRAAGSTGPAGSFSREDEVRP